MSDKNNKLELHVAEGLKPIDKTTRVTPGSGCGASLGDIQNKYFFIECKIKHNNKNIIMDYKKEWLDLNMQMPINSNKVPLVVIENKYGEKFVVMDIEDFFELALEAKGAN